jgi:hypothetical protein
MPRRAHTLTKLELILMGRGRVKGLAILYYHELRIRQLGMRRFVFMSVQTEIGKQTTAFSVFDGVPLVRNVYQRISAFNLTHRHAVGIGNVNTNSIPLTSPYYTRSLSSPKATIVPERYLRCHLARELSIWLHMPLLVWFGAIYAEINEHRDATSCLNVGLLDFILEIWYYLRSFSMVRTVTPGFIISVLSSADCSVTI